MNTLGTSWPRIEDAELLKGRAPFVADLPRPPGYLELRFVRSYAAHAGVRSLELGSARNAPGVVGVFSAEDLPGLPPMPTAPGNPVPAGIDRPGLAQDRVRFVGEAVAVIAADSAAHAEDAAELVGLELEPLPAVVGIDAATRPDAAQVFESLPNIIEEMELGHPSLPSLETSPVRFSLTVSHARLAPASMEPRGIVVSPEPGGRLTIWCSHQAPHRLRDQLADAFDLDPSRIRVTVPSVGGAFGGKSATFPEYLVAVRLARELGRSVRWIETREESLVAATHGRGQRHHLDVGASASGGIRALDVRIDLDVGAYPHTGALIAATTGLMMSGQYRIPELRVRTRTVLTNTTPTAPYRGAGRPEATLSLERMMDRLARTVGRDPLSVRIENCVSPDAFPYVTPTGARYDSGRYADALRTAAERAGYQELRAEQRERRNATRPSSLLGLGIGSYVERSGGQPGSTEFGAIRVKPDGRIVASTGSSSQGQGHRTVLAQIVGAALDLDPVRIEVVQGDTDLVRSGVGTFASRSIQIGGSALFQASLEVLDLARTAAADQLEVDRDDLTYAGGTFSTIGAPDRSVTLGELATADNLQASHVFASPQAFPYGSHVAAVEIDVETGAVALRRVVAVDDCGTVLNPQLVEGQALGSMAQGIAQALFEGAAYDETGQPLATSFLTYALPSAADLPRLEAHMIETPNPNVPLGVKGAGESGCIGTPAAIVNAVIDALDDPRIATLEMPITPERVWKLIRHR